ncbi:MAG: AAA family ATPase [Patescibacteria group bacterium]
MKTFLRLKKLELSGFKSFAKPTSFQFLDPITAVVGPNGAGKSNLAEAVRWILGEQSFKSLRGRKGEDLIFNGSPTAARLSKASAALYFDNSQKQFPIEFEEVVIGRRVYRDGQNEYLLNNSQVRLKDIIELLSNVGLGASQHHIISQGEADRVLYASPKERQSALEDALGLKIYQFKRLEAEKKLVKTEENIRQAQALAKEIRPHLKYLERLVEKIQKASEIKIELEKKLKEYLGRSEISIKEAQNDLDQRKKKPAEELVQTQEKIVRLKSSLLPAEKIEYEPKELAVLENQLAGLGQRRAKIERELGRLEGALSAAGSDRGAENETIPREEVEDLLSQIDDILSTALDTDIVEEIYSFIHDAAARINAFLSRPETDFETRPKFEELAAGRKKLEEELVKIKILEKETAEKKEKSSSAFYEAAKERRLSERELLDLEAKANKDRDILRDFNLEEEKIKLRFQELNRDFEDARQYIGDQKIDSAGFSAFKPEEWEKMRKEIDRLKFRLEESGGVDQSTLKEYSEIKERDAFLEKELADLGRAAKSFRHISRDLADKIEQDFNQGIEKINKEFQRFFEMLFGGGRARLVFLKSEKIKKNEDEIPREADENQIKEGGIEIDVSLPRKKIRGLDMLSGGERALTSIALLFSVSTVNPPPFLILDETDAALDESNSLRYGEMLKNLSRTTQIITITHNRGTMRQAGSLYGITMGTDGVSRLLSLKLTEAEEIVK